MIEGGALIASAGCLAHCLALPLIVMIMPALLASFVQGEAVHLLLLLLVLPMAFAAFWLGRKAHGAASPAIFGMFGLAALIAGALWAPVGPAEIVLSVSGSLLLICGHVINWRLRSRAIRSSAS